MAEGLKTYGLADWYGHFAASFFGNTSWQFALVALFLLYFFTHYFFASSTAQVGALFLPFAAVAIQLGAPALITCLLFGFGSNLMGAVTHYGLSPGPILFGAGYVPVRTWWILGFILSLVYIVTFIFVGGLWWKWLTYF